MALFWRLLSENQAGSSAFLRGILHANFVQQLYHDVWEVELWSFLVLVCFLPVTSLT